MAYTDFSLDQVCTIFGLSLSQTSLFPSSSPIPVPAWLRELLAKSFPLALGSEKARSEFIIAPILLSIRDLHANQISIYSGQRLDGDPSRGLTGECDFILTTTPPLPIIQAPIISIVEAKKNDIEAGLGQCAAQMLGAQKYNQRTATGITTIYGCVTTGETWQFLYLVDTTLIIDTDRYYINELEAILGVLHTLIEHYLSNSAEA